MYIPVIFKNARSVFKKDELGLEILRIALPTALALAADPIASLVDTAFIGHIGPVELAAVGVSIAVFNQVSKVAIFPIVSVTTSFVAEDLSSRGTGKVTEHQDSDNLEKALPEKNDAKELAIETGMPEKNDTKELTIEIGIPEKKKMTELAIQIDSHKLDQQLPVDIEGNSQGEKLDEHKLEHDKRHLSSASSALFFGVLLGLLQAILLFFGAKPILHLMGVKSDSPMLTPALQYLTLRSLGSPAILLSLAMQGIFRGFKDTKTPLYAIVVGDVANVILDPILMFVFHLGVRGAAIAHIISQYIISILMLWRLAKRVYILPKSVCDLQFARFLKSGSFLMARVIAVTFCVTFAASMAARLGSTPMAAFQICLQIWLATSLLCDGLAVAGQAILASALAEKDHEKAIAVVARVLQLAMVLGLALSLALGVGMPFGSRLFTKDINVLSLISIGIPFVAATQPINAIAFVLDGVIYGASDFVYSACSTVLVAILSILCLILLSKTHGFVGIWIALTIYISMRMFASLGRIGSTTGPWRFLRSSLPSS